MWDVASVYRCRLVTDGLQRRPHRRRDDPHVLVLDPKQAEPKLVTPVGVAAGKRQRSEERPDRRVDRLAPQYATAKHADVAALIGLIGHARRNDAVVILVQQGQYGVQNPQYDPSQGSLFLVRLSGDQPRVIGISPGRSGIKYIW